MRDKALRLELGDEYQHLVGKFVYLYNNIENLSGWVILTVIKW